MRRLILAAAFWPLMSIAGQAACPENLFDCPTVNAKKLNAPGVSWLAAVDYGVKADAVLDPVTGALISGTPDDAALKAAIDACSAANTELILPPRPMLIDGSVGHAMIQNCRIRGTGQHGGIYAEPKRGTTIVLTSKTVPPFHCRSDWGLQGVTFYHPNQVGAGAKFAATGSGTSLTVTGVTPIGAAGAGIQSGYLLGGAGVPLLTTIVSQSSGTPGGAGVYVTSNPTTTSGTTVTAAKPLDVYPPIISDDGTVGCSHFRIEDVTFVNPWDGIVGTPNVGWGAFYIGNVQMWAAHDLFAPGYIGDTFHVGPNTFSPGPWFGMTGATEATRLALNWAGQKNTIFHLQGPNLPWQIGAMQIAAQSFRYAFKADNTGVSFTQSMINVDTDSVGTVLSVPEGSSFPGFNTVITGTSGCNVIDWISNTMFGNSNCFEISSTSSLTLGNFLGYAMGNTVVSNGGNVTITGGQFAAGGASDGDDYAVVKLTANVSRVTVQGTYMGGVACFQSAIGCAHSRGIDTGAFTANYLLAQNNLFGFFQNAIRAKTGPGAFTITGNQSFNTAAGGLSASLSGGGPIIWDDNAFDLPPLAGVSACGSGATIHGTLRGWVVVGATAGTTTCTIAVPFAPPDAVVQAWEKGGMGIGVQPLDATTVRVSSVAGADIAGKTIYFDWRGSK